MSSAHQFQRKRCFGWGFGDRQRCAGKNIGFGNNVKIVRSNCRTVRMFRTEKISCATLFYALKREPHIGKL